MCIIIHKNVYVVDGLWPPNAPRQPHCEAQWSNIGCNPLLGFAAILHSYNYISLFVSLIHIPVRFDNVLKRIASVNDRF
jgi:hypothetical protein